MLTRRSGASYGNGLSNTPWTTLNTSVVIPIPKPIVNAATVV